MTIGNFGSFCGLFGSQGPGRLRGACGYNQRVMALPDVVIVGAARTPIGRYGGSLKNLHPADLGAAAAKAALERAHLSPGAVDEILIGHARQAGSRPNPPRQVGMRAGAPPTVPPPTIN